MSPSSTTDSLEGIAIIGMAGRFPGARNLAEFWQNLRAGRETIARFTDDELRAAGVSEELLRNPNYVKAGTVLPDMECFDAGFFGYIPREAEMMDPQHRLFLECAWEALENAGCDPSTYAGAIGVFGGAGQNSYLLNNLCTNPQTAGAVGEFATMLGNDKDFLTVRVSYKLNLKGPSVTVQTACSTSLVAVVQACQSLLNFQCDLALAGGVAAHTPQVRGYLFRDGMILSPDGHCRAFDAQAAGTVGGTGVGLVVLKRLADAVEQGDKILAVIKGAAMNNDGSLKVGFTAPSVDGQAEVVATAQAQAGIDPETIRYIETHGTGTPLGDPIEIAALTQAFRAHTPKKNFCAVGSLKPSIGHADAAAGVAGLIKLTLALHHGEIPASLHFETPNPKIDFANSPFFVNTKLTPWRPGKTPRRAGVSSFGIGGTNAHCVLEEAPVLKPTGKSRPAQLLVLSAKTASALEKATDNLAAHLKGNAAVPPFADVAFTLQTGRRAFAHRRMVVVHDAAEAVKALEARDAKKVFSHEQRTENPPVVFLFPGQGAQYVGMGQELYQTEPVFQREVDACAEILRPLLGVDLRQVLYPNAAQAEAAKTQINETRVTQLAIFTIEYALAKLWMSWGVQPAALAGHSIGEYVAGTLAGVFTLNDALKLLAVRAKLMQSLPAGSMLAVRLNATELEPRLAGKPLSLAAKNGPQLSVVSGPTEVCEAFQKELAKEHVASRFLPTSHAFHSAMMDPILTQFTEIARQTKRNAPQIPMLSTLTARWFTAADAADATYWARQMRQTVLFLDAAEELLRKPEQVLLEVGPGQILSTLARQHPARKPEQIVLASLHHSQDANRDTESMLGSLGRLWLNGLTVNWTGFYADEARRRVALPTYPFERKRHWVEPGRALAQNVVSVASTAVSAVEPGAVVEGDGATAITERIINQQLAVMAKQIEMLQQGEVDLAAEENNGGQELQA